MTQLNKPNILHLAEAVATLRKLAETGEVDWGEGFVPFETKEGED